MKVLERPMEMAIYRVSYQSGNFVIQIALPASRQSAIRRCIMPFDKSDYERDFIAERARVSRTARAQ